MCLPTPYGLMVSPPPSILTRADGPVLSALNGLGVVDGRGTRYKPGDFHFSHQTSGSRKPKKLGM